MSSLPPFETKASRAYRALQSSNVVYTISHYHVLCPIHVSKNCCIIWSCCPAEQLLIILHPFPDDGETSTASVCIDQKEGGQIVYL